MKVKFFMIPTPERLAEMVCRSRGDIFMLLGGKGHDIKKDRSAYLLFLNEISQKKQVELLVSDNLDYSDFAHYMAQAKYD